MKNLFFIIALLTSCTPVNKYFGLQDDNIVEETLEYGIRYETGLDVDLTPSSKE